MSTTHSEPTPQPTPVEWRAAPDVTAGHAAPPPPAAPQRKRGRVTAGVVALLIAVGGTTGYLVSRATSNSGGTAATAQPGAPGGAAGGNLAFQPTQYHLDGTITAVGDGTVTVKTSSGTTTTYTVTSSTHLVRDGAPATLSSFAVGDSVRASTTTQSGTTLNDMVAGDLGGGTPPQGTGTAG